MCFPLSFRLAKSCDAPALLSPPVNRNVLAEPVCGLSRRLFFSFLCLVPFLSIPTVCPCPCLSTLRCKKTRRFLSVSAGLRFRLCGSYLYGTVIHRHANIQPAAWLAIRALQALIGLICRRASHVFSVPSCSASISQVLSGRLSV